MKPDRLLVAVLHQNIDTRKELETNDFLWVYAKPSKTVTQVQHAYGGKRGHEAWPIFKVDGRHALPNQKLSELNVFGDNLVLFMLADSDSHDDEETPAAIPASTAGPAAVSSSTATQPVAAPINQNGNAPSASPGIPAGMQPRHVLSVGPPSTHSRQSSFGTPAPSLPSQNGFHPGAGALGRHQHLAMESPLSIMSRTPTPIHTSPARAATTSAAATQPQYHVGSPMQPFTQYSSQQSPFRHLPAPQPANGYPGTPANAHDFASHIYGQAPASPVVRLNEGSHPGDPPTKHQRQFPTMYNHDNQWDSSSMMPDSAHPDPASHTEADKPEPQNQSLQTLMSENDLEFLEAGVKQALKLLGKIEQPLAARQGQDPDAKEWLKSINDLKSQNLKNQTILGVVGNTGAGKSSVINAMLDEERLVPTNCMRACTAVVTEMSWNDSDEYRSRYRAEIEFIKYEDWLRELQVLYSDMLDGNGNMTRDSSHADTDAGIAWAKIKAVYPQKTKDMIALTTPERLALEVQGLLGTTKRINESDSGDFYKRLQYFVDSQEKVKDSKEKKRMEYWPLIKVVKIYTKAEALSTGAVVVDLPGVQDSNAARAAVAEGYMKQCSGLWIVAPITRAVDDKAAKKLLGDTFKRQLKLDGTYDNVTFICSKTDDISLQEAVSGLHLDETASSMWADLDDVRNEIQSRKDKLEQLKELKVAYLDSVEDCDEQLDLWENLLEECTDGKIVYAPTENAGKKRKRSSSAKKSKKKRRTDDSDDEFIDDDDESAADSDATQSESEDEAVERREPLTKQQIEDKIQELKNMKKEAKSERGVIDDQMKGIRKEIKELKEKEASIDDKISRLCINGRNEYSRGAIKQDFAAGIRELDQETAEEENAEEFDPEVDLRDYEEVARSLPVFCVSSRAYQKLCGRLKRDSNVPGFKDVSQTEIPKLQAHCKQLTEAGRIACARRFLNTLSQFLTSMSLWATNDGPNAHISADQRRQEQTFLTQKLEELKKSIQKVVRTTLEEMAATVAEHVYGQYPKLIQKACEAAVPTASGWGVHRNMGGLHYSTYKATVRRDGVYNGASGARDFNAELTAPILKEIATGWERAFQRRLPTNIRNFKSNVSKEVEAFHNLVCQRARRVGVSMARLNQLNNQLRNHTEFLNTLVAGIIDLVSTRQKEVNREFVPVIASAMQHAYQVATDESGKGSYIRMKAYVNNHVAQNQDRMFRDACQAVKNRLDQMCHEVQEQLADRAAHVFTSAQRDYNSAVGNLGAAEVELTPAEKELRNEINGIVKTAEEVFERVLEGEEDPDDVAARAEEEAAAAADENNEGADAGQSTLKGEDATAQDGDNEGPEPPTTLKEKLAAPNEPAAEQPELQPEPLSESILKGEPNHVSTPNQGSTLAQQLLAAQYQDQENAVDPMSKSTSRMSSAEAVRPEGGPVLGVLGNHAMNRNLGDAGPGHFN
ncbi:hypothetical protein IWZ01DRAFT_537433 [Phyllosticta capitalensis]